MATINLFPNDTVNGSTIADVQAAGANAPFAGKYYTQQEWEAFINAANAVGPGNPAWDDIVGCIVRANISFPDGTGPRIGPCCFVEDSGNPGNMWIESLVGGSIWIGS